MALYATNKIIHSSRKTHILTPHPSQNVGESESDDEDTTLALPEAGTSEHPAVQETTPAVGQSTLESGSEMGSQGGVPSDPKEPQVDVEGQQGGLAGGASSLGRRASLEGGMEGGLEAAVGSGGVSAEGSEDALDSPVARSQGSQARPRRSVRPSAPPADVAHG